VWQVRIADGRNDVNGVAGLASVFLVLVFLVFILVFAITGKAPWHMGGKVRTNPGVGWRGDDPSDDNYREAPVVTQVLATISAVLLVLDASRLFGSWGSIVGWLTLLGVAVGLALAAKITTGLVASLGILGTVSALVVDQGLTVGLLVMPPVLVTLLLLGVRGALLATNALTAVSALLLVFELAPTTGMVEPALGAVFAVAVALSVGARFAETPLALFGIAGITLALSSNPFVAAHQFGLAIAVAFVVLDTILVLWINGSVRLWRRNDYSPFFGDLWRRIRR
jgi:hypothetical protein